MDSPFWHDCTDSDMPCPYQDDQLAEFECEVGWYIKRGATVYGPFDSEAEAYGEALDAIAEIMSGNEWDADTMDAVARIVRETGRTVANYEPGDDDNG